jgi:hypothetical protein
LGPDHLLVEVLSLSIFTTSLRGLGGSHTKRRGLSPLFRGHQVAENLLGTFPITKVLLAQDFFPRRR